MRTGDFEKFSNAFLFLEGEQAVVRSDGQQDRERAKRPHTKSRNGCLACKKRRVKCDECLPCGHCVSRREKCERPDARPAQGKVQVPQQPSNPQHVNTLHIEMFYHFEKSTVHTLSFPEIWDLMMQLSFQHEYLMHAILAIAAKHMSFLRPQYPVYSEAAIVLLNKSIQSFRGTLDAPITAHNCEARLGTSFLLNYMAWTELGFLEGQNILANPEAGGLDMSTDLLFPMGSGVRQVFFTAFAIFRLHDSPFIKVGQYHPCDNLEKEANSRGTEWQTIMQRFLCLFDNPSYQGSRTVRGSSPNCHGSTASQDDMDLDIDPEPTCDSSPGPDCTSSAGASLSTSACQELSGPECFSTVLYSEHYLQKVIERTNNDSSRILRTMAEGLTDRIIYERIVQRLSVLLSFIPEDGSERVPLPEARQHDVERYLFSFPTLCFGPFLALILENDSRVLVVLHHTYRVANRLLLERTWWAKERALTMERLTLAELNARGLSADV